MLQSFERRLWSHQHVLRQFEGLLTQQILGKLEDLGLNAERLLDMDTREIGAILRHPSVGATVKGCMHSVPAIRMEAHLQPITRCCRPSEMYRLCNTKSIYESSKRPKFSPKNSLEE